MSVQHPKSHELLTARRLRAHIASAEIDAALLSAGAPLAATIAVEEG